MAMATLVQSSFSLSSSPSPSPSPILSHWLRRSGPPMLTVSSSNFLSGGDNSAPLLQLSWKPLIVPVARRPMICAFALKKVDSAVKRARQSEKQRVCNKSRKSEIHTRMKKVFVALDVLKKQSEPLPDDISPIEKLIAEAYSVIDKAAKIGTIHPNTAARRKSRLARAKKATSVQLGFYTPSAA